MSKNKSLISYNAPVTLTFALISLISLILGYLTHFESTELLFVTYRSSFLNPLTYVRMFTHCLGHADWSHYYGNMMYILLLGPMIEEKYGKEKTIMMIVFTSFVAALVNMIFFPYVGLCGASGICFLFIVLSSVTSLKDRRLPLTLILILVIYLGREVYNMIFVIDSVSQLSHIIGGVCGAIFGLEFNKQRY